jgi:hypothetical protein
MVAPWEQLAGESAKAHAAFCLYRDLGPRRSLAEASRAYHGAAASGPAARRRRWASGQVRAWAERWHWSARAQAWDQELERLHRDQQRAALEEMDERHARETLLVQSKAVERLRQLRPEELKPRETLQYLVEGIRIERLVRGEPTERVAAEHRFPDVRQLSDDDLLHILAGGGDLPGSGGGGTAPASPGPDKPA